MTDTPDPLDRLRAADPVPRAVSRPDDSTLEEILMSTTQTPSTDSAAPASKPARSMPLLLGVAAAVLLVIGVIGAVLVGGDDGPTEEAGVDTGGLPTDPEPGTDDPAAGGPAIPEPGNSEVTSCVEQYSPETLAAREYAFDGTVQSVDGQDMTFAVDEWFIGGSEPTITLDHQGYAGMLLDPSTALEPGTRALIAGDGGFVWSCGFTQLWTEASAAEWRAATGG